MLSLRHAPGIERGETIISEGRRYGSVIGIMMNGVKDL